MDGLLVGVLLGFIQLVVMLGIFVFLPAGTFDYWQAWLFGTVFFVWAAIITAWLWRHDRALLSRRLRAGPIAEKDTEQRVIQLFAAIIFCGSLALPSLDHRLGWSPVPADITIFGDALVAIGFFLIFLVFRENTYTSSIIEVANDQKVISTGPYSLVRHPLYSAALIMMFGVPLSLGSWWGLTMSAAMAAVLVWRLRSEERYLNNHLAGYAQYRRTVRYRLIPYIW